METCSTRDASGRLSALSSGFFFFPTITLYIRDSQTMIDLTLFRNQPNKFRNQPNKGAYVT